ncbi:hypothetical protein CC1G_13546 [Coprinopsis cinerea okayama7|uniref:Uncharacterized protein n=1 Tax=Coprinopsis cinerea (strain Okayama-7 / 130 / ATCC MYA-4618 / FGSC 9003) TaxID=240176 RepID=D6RJZ0_COPC7|nr:hypothetical protein CC1G_13546 [Coprinopsis cinerea okayama7\|eukprot:XP_002912018.1 hypothetical protein CC1G_13546 [Coprinopsis cinerea okayama7\
MPPVVVTNTLARVPEVFHRLPSSLALSSVHRHSSSVHRHSSSPIPAGSSLDFDARRSRSVGKVTTGARARGLAAVPELSDPPDNLVDFRRALGKLSNGFRIVYSKSVMRVRNMGLCQEHMVANYKSCDELCHLFQGQGGPVFIVYRKRDRCDVYYINMEGVTDKIR